MFANIILDAIELEHTVATDNGDVESGLIDLGWERYAPAQDCGVIGSIWRHRDNDQAHAQSGTQGDNFYFGVIAGFQSNADATACFHRALERIQPHLTAAGFESDRRDSKENHLWTNATYAVILSIMPQRARRTHVLPAAVQFAIQPVTALVDAVGRTTVPHDASL